MGMVAKDVMDITVYCHFVLTVKRRERTIQAMPAMLTIILEACWKQTRTDVYFFLLKPYFFNSSLNVESGNPAFRRAAETLSFSNFRRFS